MSEENPTRAVVPPSSLIPPNGCSLVLLVLLATNYFIQFGDLDYTWQIRTGGEMVRTGDPRPEESFSYTIPGTRPPDFEWLYEVVLWGVWSVFGYGGLKLLKTLVILGPLLIVTWHLRRQGVRWHGIALALAAAVLALTPAWNLRAYQCSTMGLLLAAAWLHDHCTNRRPLPWALPLVMLLWGNVHPSVIMGQALLVGAIGWEWLNRWLQWNTPLANGALRRLTLIGGLGLAATLVTPDPLERLAYPFRPELRHPIQRIFVEMQPLYQGISGAPLVVVTAYALAALAALTIVLRFRHYRLWEVALLVALGGLANTARRGLPDWLLVMLLLSVPHLVQLLRQAAARRRQQPAAALLLRFDCFCKRACHSPLLRFQAFWPLAGLALLTVVSLTPPLCWHMPVQEDRDWPTRAVDFIEARGYRGNFFGPPDYGAYVTWRLGDRAKCYTDTRGFFFPPFLLEDSHNVPQLAGDWRARLDCILNQYHTDYFLLETQGPRGELWLLLQPHLGEPLYLDQQTVLLSREQVLGALKEISHK